MKVLIKGVHLRVSRGLREYIDKHLVRPVRRFVDDTAAELTVHLADTNGPKGGLDKECRATLRLPGIRPLRITERGDDPYLAITRARARLERVAKEELARQRMPKPYPRSRARRAAAPSKLTN